MPTTTSSDPRRRHRARIATAALFLTTVAIWAYAGFAIGEVRGRGWRGAVIDNGCRIACPPAAPAPSKGARL